MTEVLGLTLAILLYAALVLTQWRAMEKEIDS